MVSSYFDNSKKEKLINRSRTFYGSAVETWSPYQTDYTTSLNTNLVYQN